MNKEEKRLNDNGFYFMGCPPRSEVLKALGISKEQDDALQLKYSSDAVKTNQRGALVMNITKQEYHKNYGKKRRAKRKGFIIDTFRISP